MAFYMIGILKTDDLSWLREYGEGAARTVKKHGGKYLVQTDDIEQLEGSVGKPHVVVIMEFPDREKLQQWFADPEYQPYEQMRLEKSECQTLLCPSFAPLGTGA